MARGSLGAQRSTVRFPRVSAVSRSARTRRFNARIMVEELRVDDPEADEAQAGSAFVSQLDHVLRESLHVTIGLRNDVVRPVEAEALVTAFRKGAGTDVRSVPLDNVYVKGRVQGLSIGTKGKAIDLCEPLLSTLC